MAALQYANGVGEACGLWAKDAVCYFFLKKKAVLLCRFGKYVIPLQLKTKSDAVNNYITQARDVDLIPSGLHVCQLSLRSHFRCRL